MKSRRKLLTIAGALLIVAAVAGASVFFALQLERFSLDATTDSLVLQSDPDLEFYNASRKVFGTDEYVIVAFSAGDVLSPDNVKLVDTLSREFRDLAGVSSVFGLATAPLLRSPVSASLSLENPITLTSPECDSQLARQELRGHSVYSRNIISDDGRTTAMLVYFADDPHLSALEKKLSAARQAGTPPAALEAQVWDASLDWKKRRRDTVMQIRQILKEHATPQRKFYLSGVPVVVNDMVVFIKDDLRFFGFGVSAFLFLGLFVMFRRLRWVLLPMITCLIVVVWITAMMALAQKPTTVVTANLSSLLFIIAMAHSIHLIVGYQETGEAAGHSGRTMLAMRKLITPCVYTAATTAVGFASLLICDIQPVKDFGIYMSIGVGLALLVSFTFFPAALLLLGGRGLGRIKQHAAPRFLGFLATLAVRRRLPVALLAIGLVVASVFGIASLSTETRFIDYFRRDSAIYTGLDFIDNNMGGTTSLEIILSAPEPGYFKSQQAIPKLRGVQEEVEKRSEIGKVISLANFADEFDKLVDDIVKTTLKNYGPMAAGMIDRDKLREFALEKAPRSFLKPYVSEDFSQARIFIRVRETAPGLVRNELIADIRALMNSRPELGELNPRLSGIFLLYSNMLNSLISSQVWSFWVVFAAIYIMFLALFRSFQVAAYAMIPNVLPVLLVLGVMGFTGVHLDMMTIMIASVSLGIGADGAIHYIFRYKKELQACGADPVEALHRSHASIGRAILFTSLTVVIGFWILVFSNFTPTIYFGLFTGLTMLASLAGSLVLLPLCLVTFKPFRLKKPHS